MAAAAALLTPPESRPGPWDGQVTLPPPATLVDHPGRAVRVGTPDGPVVVQPVGSAALNAFDTTLADALAFLAEAHTRLHHVAAGSADGRLAAVGEVVAAALGAVRAVAAHDLVARPFGAVVVLAGCDGLLSVLLDRLAAPAPELESEALPELVAERFGLDLAEVG